jgi:hypothetical protein
VEAAAEVFPKTDWQRCVVHFYRNVFSHVPNGKVAEVARMLKAIHAQESLSVDVGRCETQTHRIDQMGQAAIPGDGPAAQPRKAGGGSLRTRSAATDSKAKVRKTRCTISLPRLVRREGRTQSGHKSVTETFSLKTHVTVSPWIEEKFMVARGGTERPTRGFSGRRLPAWRAGELAHPLSP